MAVPDIVLAGFGASGSASLIVTIGFTGGAPVPPVLPAAIDPGDSPGKSPHRGFDLKRWKRERLDLEGSIQETYDELMHGPEPIRAEAEQAVAAHQARTEAEAVNWDALARDVEALEKLRALRAWLQRERELADDEEAAAILLLH